MIYWLKQVRMYTTVEDLEKLLAKYKFKFYKRMNDTKLGSILVFEK